MRHLLVVTQYTFHFPCLVGKNPYSSKFCCAGQVHRQISFLCPEFMFAGLNGPIQVSMVIKRVYIKNFKFTDRLVGLVAKGFYGFNERFL